MIANQASDTDFMNEGLAYNKRGEYSPKQLQHLERSIQRLFLLPAIALVLTAALLLAFFVFKAEITFSVNSGGFITAIVGALLIFILLLVFFAEYPKQRKAYEERSVEIVEGQIDIESHEAQQRTYNENRVHGPAIQYCLVDIGTLSFELPFNYSYLLRNKAWYRFYYAPHNKQLLSYEEIKAPERV